MEGTSVKVHGIRELHRALKQYSDDLKKELDVQLKAAGQKVAARATSLFSAIDARSAAGFQSRLKGFGRVVVQQRYRKRTGQHPEFGSLQMRTALIPARHDEYPTIIQHLETMLDTLGRKGGF